MPKRPTTFDYKFFVSDVSKSGSSQSFAETNLMAASMFSFDGSGICELEVAKLMPSRFAEAIKIKFLHGKCFPSFRFVAEKVKKREIPDEAFFFLDGCLGACPAIRVKRCVQEKMKERFVKIDPKSAGAIVKKESTMLIRSVESIITLSTEVGIINLTKKSAFHLDLMISQSNQKTWANTLLRKALGKFDGGIVSSADFVKIGPVEVDDGEKLRLAILLHYKAWCEEKGHTLNGLAARLAEYGLEVKNPKPDPKEPRHPHDGLKFHGGHLSAIIKRMKIVDMNDKKSLKSEKEPVKGSETKPTVKQLGSETKTVKGSKATNPSNKAKLPKRSPNS